MRPIILLTLISTLVSCPRIWAAVASPEETGLHNRMADKGMRPPGSDAYVSPSFSVTNICQFQHATFVAVPDFPVASNPYNRVKWEMGDGTTYNLTLPPGPPPATFNWMHTLHRYQLPGNYTVTMTLYFPNNTFRSFSNVITANPQPERPATTRKLDFCMGVTTTPLTATPAPGNTILWYAEGPTGVYKLPGAPSPSTATVGFSQYRVTQITPLGCESYEDTVTVTISTMPAAPTVVSPVKYCEGATPVSLQSSVTIPTGTSIRWYDSNDPASALLPTAPTPGTAATNVPGRSYFASLVSLAGCGEGPRSQISVVVHPKPAAPTAPAVNTCKDATGVFLPTLTPIAGHVLHWWGTDATGGSWTFTARVPSTGTVGTVNYYVSHWQQSTGCESDRTLIPVTTHPVPTASISGGATLCMQAPEPLLKFTGAGGTAPYRFAYKIDGGAVQQIQTTGTGNEVSLPIPTSAAGSKTFELMGVLDANTCGQIQSGQAIFQVRPNPAATLSGATEICEGSPSPSIQLSASNGKAPYTFTYRINSGAEVNVTSVNGTGNQTLTVPTATARDFIYRLERVSYSDGVTCSTTIGSEAKVTVHPNPDANLLIPGQTANLLKICQASTTTSLRFQANGGLEPYTLTYRMNGGASQTIVLPVGSSTQDQPVPTTTVGTFRFDLLTISDARNCRRTLSNANATVTVLAQPDATVSGATDVCQNGSGSPLTFTGSGGTAPYLFTWQVDGGPDQTGPSMSGSSSMTVTPPTNAAGQKNYRLTKVSYTDGPTCHKDLSITKAVVIHAPPTAPSTSDASFCLGASGATLPSVTPATGHTLRWYGTSATGGTPTTAPPIPAVSNAGDLQYFVSQYENQLGCESDRAAIRVTTHPLPTASISETGGAASPVLRCQDAPAGSISFTGATGLAPYKFTYRIDNGPEQSATGTTAAPMPAISVPTNTPGTYRFELRAVEDARGCRQNQTGSVTFGIRATPDASIDGSTTLCKDATAPNLIFTGSRGTNPYQFTYRLNGGAIQTMSSDIGKDTAGLRQPTQVPGIYVYELLQVAYTNGITCAKNLTGTATITINTIPQGTLTAEASLVERCQYGNKTTLLMTGTGGKSPYRFEYDLNGTQKTASGQPTYSAIQETRNTGLFSYRLLGIKDANGCTGPVSGSADVRIWPAPIVDAGPDQWILEGQRATLAGTASNGNGLIFAWTPSVSLSDPTSLRPVATPLNSTRYLLKVTTDKGCSDTSSAMVTVLLIPEIPNTFTPNGDGVNDRWEIRNLDRYPGAVVEVYNTMGALVYRSSGYSQPWDGTHAGRQLPAGTYYYVVHPRYGREKKAGYVTILR